jgi:predicted glycoside hydrolase/deacetylase ChbG (UPF0249 family)
VNADDFGEGQSVNKAIIELFNRGLLTSTTLMANMPGFDEAIELAHKNKITGRIGAHLVLTDGKPLTPEVNTIPYLFNKEANPRKTLIRNLFFIDKKNEQLIFNEYCKQIEKIRKNGIAITHLDTHHHVHEIWGILKIMFVLLKKYDIPTIRIYNNIKDNGLHKNLYRLAVNKYLKAMKVNYTDYFCDRTDFLSMLAKNPNFPGDKKVELMVHPTYNTNGKLIDTLKNEEYDFEYLNINTDGAYPVEI